MSRGVAAALAAVAVGPVWGQPLDQSRFRVQAEWQNQGQAPILIEQDQAFNPDFNLFWFVDRNNAALQQALTAQGASLEPPVVPDFGALTQLGVNQTVIVPAIPPATGSPLVFGAVKSILTVEPAREARVFGETTFVVEVFRDNPGGTPPSVFDASFVPTVSLDLTTVDPTAGGIQIDATVRVDDPANPSVLGPEHTFSASRGPGGNTGSGTLLDPGGFTSPTPGTGAYDGNNTAPPFDFTGLTQGQRLEFTIQFGIGIDNQGLAAAQIDAFNSFDWSFATSTPGVRLTPVLESSQINGDYNGSGQVEQGDLDLVLLNWGRSSIPAPAGWVQQFPTGLIDQAELDGVLLNWGRTSEPTAGGTVVPEPGAMAALGVLGWIGWRRCRTGTMR